MNRFFLLGSIMSVNNLPLSTHRQKVLSLHSNSPKMLLIYSSSRLLLTDQISLPILFPWKSYSEAYWSVYGLLGLYFFSFIKTLLCTSMDTVRDLVYVSHFVMYLMCVISFNPHSNSVKWMLLFPCDLWENWSPEILSYLSN